MGKTEQKYIRHLEIENQQLRKQVEALEDENRKMRWLGTEAVAIIQATNDDIKYYEQQLAHCVAIMGLLESIAPMEAVPEISVAIEETRQFLEKRSGVVKQKGNDTK